MRKLIMLLLAFSVVAAACGSGEDEAEAPATTAATQATTTTTAAAEEPMAEMDIVDTAVATDGFATLVAAVQAADLVDTLKSDGPFTVFAPTDDAFASALDALGLTADELLADTETLTSILTYHVIAGEVLAADVTGLAGQEVPTVQGSNILVTVDGGVVRINDAAVTATDITTSNGVIHVIDSVILPPSA